MRSRALILGEVFLGHSVDIKVKRERKIKAEKGGREKGGERERERERALALLLEDLSYIPITHIR